MSSERNGDAPAVEQVEHSGGADTGLRELVVCSLEAWDEVWRRNQFFVGALLKRNPELRVLFVEPPADVLFDLRSRRRPTLPRFKKMSRDRRLRAFRPLKPAPRQWGGFTDRALMLQVRLATKAIGFSQPALWINDVTYAPLISTTAWPSLYDVTDDWLLAPFPPREIERLRRLDELALRRADEVVVCSPALLASRGEHRDVSLIPNGVDIEHFRRPQGRPADMPEAPTAVYVGSLHESRLDVELVADLARALASLNVVLVGPDSLGPSERQILDGLPNVFLLGARPYRDVPGYLQHSSVVIVPHRVSAFTESLDPIKAYECLAVGRPTVATPVAGFRDHHDVLDVVDRNNFVAQVSRILDDGSPRFTTEPVGWDERSRAFETVLLRSTIRTSRQRS